MPDPIRVTIPATPAEGERQLLVTLARALLRAPLVGKLLGEEDRAAVERALAIVEAPRSFVCRAHQKPFSSSTPCPGCAGERPAVGFAADGEAGCYHVVLAGGRSVCDKPHPGAFVTKIPSAVDLCGVCHARSPAAVWSTDFTGSKEAP